MTDKIILSNNELSTILICAFRYALGRKSYITGTIADMLLKHWDELKFNDKITMRKEILHAIDTGKAGMDMDVAEWNRVLEKFN